MFLGLRQYFFLTPVRPQDLWALVASYLTIPLGLWPAFLGRREIFLEAVPLGLFLVVPVTLCLSDRQTGLLDSLGRVLLGATIYVYCAGFLGLLSHQTQGTLELFAILAMLAELTQRLAGRLRPGEGMPRRVYTYAQPEFQPWNLVSTIGAIMLAVSAIPFFINAIRSLMKGNEAGPNPWRALGLEWTVSSPPPTHNFPVPPVVTRDSYGYGEVPIPVPSAPGGN